MPRALTLGRLPLAALACALLLAPPRIARAQTEAGIAVSRIVLNDGQELRGRIVAQEGDTVVLELVSGGRITLPANAIRSIEVEQAHVSAGGELWGADPNRTRYLYAPSAMMLKQGEGYFSQKELFFSAVAVGVTDHVSVLVGSVLPAVFAGTDGINLIGAAKVGGSVGERFHLAAGAETLVLPSFGSFGFAFGSATYGVASAHVTLSAGKAFVLSNTQRELGSWIVVASGNLRVSSHLALVTENWFFPGSTAVEGQPLLLDAAALRIIAGRFAVDLGALRVPFAHYPLPWLDFTWNW